MMGHKVRSWRLAKIYSLVMRVPDLQEKMKDTKFVVYVNACRGSEEEPLKMVEYDSLPHEPANRMPSTPRFHLRNPITSDDATNVIVRANRFDPEHRNIETQPKHAEESDVEIKFQNVSMNQYTGTTPGSTPPRVVIVRDKFGAAAADFYKEIYEKIGYICSDLDVSDKKSSIEDLLQSVKQIIFVVIITPENARYGWVIKEGKNGLDDETAEPSKYIKKFSSIAVAIPQLFIIDSWLMKTSDNQCLVDTDEIEQTSESTERIRRRCVPRDTNIFMIFSNSLSDLKFSPFASLFKKTIDQLRKDEQAGDGTIDTILRKIIQETPANSQVPEIQHQGVSKFSLW
ncbi:unnamed protein product [Oikopleura dioica]|uniref:Uncharacterized protein n=1 Tax=Oikopleura dioica TaxID=34765 RepID=E4Y847_OIKDI|nr:unnamed protein product [Oikopleura dioica]